MRAHEHLDNAIDMQQDTLTLGNNSFVSCPDIYKHFKDTMKHILGALVMIPEREKRQQYWLHGHRQDFNLLTPQFMLTLLLPF